MARQPQLTVPAVRLIRRVYDAARETGRRPNLAPLAKRYQFASRTAIWQVAHRVTYKWVRE